MTPTYLHILNGVACCDHGVSIVGTCRECDRLYAWLMIRAALVNVGAGILGGRSALDLVVAEMTIDFGDPAVRPMTTRFVNDLRLIANLDLFAFGSHVWSTDEPFDIMTAVHEVASTRTRKFAERWDDGSYGVGFA